MTTWNHVKDFIHKHYKATDIDEGLLRLVFETADLRSQIVFVERTGNERSGDWIKFTSPIGKVGEVDLLKGARELNTLLFGGLVADETHVYVATGTPIKNLDSNELTDPLERIAYVGDSLERILTGRDDL